MGSTKYPARLMPLRSPSALREQLAQHDADVFHGVVLVDIQIALGVELQIEAAMLGEQLQHVIEEADAGGDFVPAAAFDPQRAADVRFLGVALGWRRCGFLMRRRPLPGN